MSTNHTPNYNLSQWEPGDQVLRTDFNADNAKLDAAIADAKPKYVVGTYTGDGVTDGRIIPLPFTPKIVLLSGCHSAFDNVPPQAGFAVIFGPYVCEMVGGGSFSTSGIYSIVENGFKLECIRHNWLGKKEQYMAIG